MRFQTLTAAEAAGLYADVEDAAPSTRMRVRHALSFDDDILDAFSALGVGRRLLDIGSGDGGFLRAAVARGFDCVGVDVSENLAKFASEKSGAPVLVGELTDLGLPRASFDWVNFDQVLSYVTKPRDVAQEVAALLRPGGFCRIREYNPDSLSARLKGKRYWMYAPTIVNVWPPRAIQALAEASGLRVARVIAGTEASLASWLTTARKKTLPRRLTDTILFGMRRVQVGGFRVAADTVYYLRKP